VILTAREKSVLVEQLQLCLQSLKESRELQQNDTTTIDSMDELLWMDALVASQIEVVTSIIRKASYDLNTSRAQRAAGTLRTLRSYVQRNAGGVKARG
jgi:hypothetical protein